MNIKRPVRIAVTTKCINPAMEVINVYTFVKNKATASLNTGITRYSQYIDKFHHFGILNLQIK
jgi:hypothetical protein